MINARKFLLGASLGLAISITSIAYAQPHEELPLQPRQPGGRLSPAIGRLLTIEGVMYSGGGKVESNSLLVDVVNGAKVPKPFPVLVRNVKLPAKQRCILKGYELGEMVGRPPAEYELTRELGNDPDELARFDQAEWQWRPYFVPLLAIEPQGLEVSTRWGLNR